MSEHWILSKEINRTIGEQKYFRYRISIPKTDHDALAHKLGARDRVYLKAKIQPGKVTLEIDSCPEPDRDASEENVEERARKIKQFTIGSGGVTTWWKVREHFGYKQKTPGPFLVRALERQGIESVDDPKTSTRIWRLRTSPDSPHQPIITNYTNQP